MKVGETVSFYHEGGRGERRWVIGWRAGRIVSLPSRGAKKTWAQIELPAKRYTRNLVTGVYEPRPLERVWVHRDSITALGETKLRCREAALELLAVKKAEQAKADKRKRRAA